MENIPINPKFEKVVSILLDTEVKRTTRLLKYEEALSACGSGWLEQWFEPFLARGNMEFKVLYRCVFISGFVMNEYGHIERLDIEKHYNRPFNFRLWLGDERPTDAQRDAAPWEG